MNTNLEFLYPTPPTSEEAVAAFEKELDFRLPEDYRQFLLRYNGGEMPNRHRFAYNLLNGKDMRSFVEILFGIGLEERTRDVRIHQKMQSQPAYFFVIGYAMGSILGLGITRETFGKVYAWENTVNNDILFLANSFNEFLNMLEATES